MRRTVTFKGRAKSAESNPWKLRKAKGAAPELKTLVHVIRKGVRCDTEERGHERPRGRSPMEILVNAPEGFIPLWARGTTLRWQFQERSMYSFQNPEAAKAAIEQLLGEALLAWGDAAPVRFSKQSDAWDFEIVMRTADDCNVNGCVLASAFFPDAGRHELVLYPKMFTQDRKEQVETLVHEVGHIFGLRHFFAQVSERAWPSEIFGKHSPFSIMNYGSQSVLTEDDRADLARLYRMAWNGTLTNINGTPIRFVTPFHTNGTPPDSMVAVGPVQAAFQP